jgi:ribonuclease Y
MILVASLEWTVAGCVWRVVVRRFFLWRGFDLWRGAFAARAGTPERAKREAETVVRGSGGGRRAKLQRRRELEEEWQRRRRDRVCGGASGTGRCATGSRPNRWPSGSALETDRRGSRSQQALTSQERECEVLLRRRQEQLASAAHLPEADARAHLLREIQEEAQKDAADLARHLLESARGGGNQARRIIALAVQRYAGEQALETTTAAVSNGHDIKGRIIGREGRNIRAFEAETGVTVLIDDTPGTVLLSGFDPVRREVARQAMERLIADGRIHPGRIEEVVRKVREEMEETILRSGEEAVFKVGLPPLHVEVVKLLAPQSFATVTRRTFWRIRSVAHGRALAMS